MVRPYFEDADWHWWPIPASPVLDSQSATIVNQLKLNQHVMNLIEFGNTLRGPSGITGSTPRYTVASAQDGEWGPAFESGTTIPIPAGTESHLPTGSDCHLAIADPTTNRVYSMWIAGKTGSSWHCEWGGETHLDGDGRETTGGSTGAGISRFACVVREAEIAAGVIPHALFFSTDIAKNDDGVYPATKSDGGNDAGVPTNATISEGKRVQLNPALNPDDYGLNAGERAIFVALQTYGAYCGDNGGARMAFLCEFSTTRSGDNPGDGYEAVGIDGDYFSLSKIPWASLRVLQYWDGRDGTGSEDPTGGEATAAAPLGGLTGHATAVPTVHATAAAPLGALTSAATAQVVTVANANLGSLAAAATAGVTVHATGTAPLGALAGTTLAGVLRADATGSAPLGTLSAHAGGAPLWEAQASAALGALVATAELVQTVPLLEDPVITGPFRSPLVIATGPRPMWAS